MIAPQTFSDVLDASRHEEQRTALRSLLMRPVLFSGVAAGDKPSVGDGPRRAKYVEESFVLVRRHQGYLTNWLARYTGWTLILRSGSARLVKRPVDIDDPTRGAIDSGSSGNPLSRARYVLWCLTLAVLHEEGRQTTLQRLAERVVRTSESMPELTDAGIEFDLKTAGTRRALVCIVRMLLSHGVVRRVEGDETRFAESATTDCLYDVDTGLLTDMLYTSATLAETEGEGDRLEQRLERFFPELTEQALRPRDLEHRLMRRLLDNPVMYFDELTEREFQYWQSQRSRLLQVIEEAVGVIAEVRAEGVALLDPMGELTDAKMPDSGTVGHASLLIAEFLAEQGKTQQDPASTPAPPASVSLETLTAQLADLACQHESHWRKNITDPAQIELLLDQVLGRLEMLRMVRRQGRSIQPLPAIHRFTAGDLSE